MNFIDILTEEMTTLIIVLSVTIPVVLLLIAGFIVIDRIFLQKRRCKKNLRDLISRYEYLHALLTGQDASYISRLEIISRTNLLYSDIYTTYFKRAKEIKDTSDVKVHETIGDLQNLIDENRIKDFKELYRNKTTLFKQYEQSVNSLTSDLVNVIKPEEDLRQQSLTLKEKYRDVKSKYNLSEQSLAFVSDSFQNVFNHIDNHFNMIEDFIETANYEDGKKVLPKIEGVLNRLDELIDQIPSLEDEVNVKLPLDIEGVKNEYLRLTKEGKPLRHLGVEFKCEEMNSQLEKIRISLKNLTIDGLQENIDKMHETIKNILDEFSKESEAFVKFNASKDDVISNFQEYEKEFIRITNNMDKFAKYYVIDQDHVALKISIQKQLEEVAQAKRRVDLYMHSAQPTPYSRLFELLQILEKGTNDLGIKVKGYSEYLESLKNDSEEAFKNLKIKYELLKDNEYVVREFKIPAHTEYFKPKFDSIYQILDSISALVRSSPIDVSKVNVLNSRLNNDSNNLIKEIQDLNHYKELASNNILLVNRDRMKFAEINNIISQAESLYLDGNFKASFEMSDQAIEKLSFRDQK